MLFLYLFLNFTVIFFTNELFSNLVRFLKYDKEKLIKNDKLSGRDSEEREIEIREKRRGFILTLFYNLLIY